MTRNIGLCCVFELNANCPPKNSGGYINPILIFLLLKKQCKTSMPKKSGGCNSFFRGVPLICWPEPWNSDHPRLFTLYLAMKACPPLTSALQWLTSDTLLANLEAENINTIILLHSWLIRHTQVLFETAKKSAKYCDCVLRTFLNMVFTLQNLIILGQG